MHPRDRTTPAPGPVTPDPISVIAGLDYIGARIRVDEYGHLHVDGGPEGLPPGAMEDILYHRAALVAYCRRAGWIGGSFDPAQQTGRDGAGGMVN